MTRSARVVALLLGLLLLLSTGGPAGAEDTALGHRAQVALSLDGEHYDGAIAQPLFDPAVRWVPGDARRSRFWVRNQAVGPADLTLDLLSRNRQSLLDSGELTISARTGDGPWQTVGRSTRLLTQENVPAEAELPVTVRVELAPGAPNGAMVLATDLDFRVTLTEARASEPGGQSAGPGGVLPGTGATASWWVVPLGLLLLSAGLLLLARRRPHDTPSTVRTTGDLA